MTRKDFQLIADAMREAFPGREISDAYVTWATACHKLANGLETTNPRFDRSRFLAACGLEG